MENGKRMGHAFWAGRLSATCAVAMGLMVAARAEAAVSLRVATNDAVPGGTLTLTMSLMREAGDPQVAGAQTDVILSTAQLELLGKCGGDGAVCENGTICGQTACAAPCVKSSRLTQHTVPSSFPDFQNVPADSRRLRLPVDPEVFPPPTFSEGELIVCTFKVLPTAPLGSFDVRPGEDRYFRVTDADGNEVPATLTIEAGQIVPELPTQTPAVTATTVPTEPPTATATEDAVPSETPTSVPPTDTHTPETETPSVSSPTPTLTPVVPTSTPTGPTPTATGPTATLPPTNTPTVGQHTPTRVPTSTSTSTAVPTPTMTSGVGTVTPTAGVPTPTPTPTSTGAAVRHGSDDDGCAIVAGVTEARSASGLWWVVLPGVVLFLRARRR